MDRMGVPEFVLTVAPLMRELLNLREENLALRIKTNPPLPELDALTADSPIRLRHDTDGKWSADIDLAPDYRTGVSGYPDARSAFLSALNHIRDSWQARERELAGDDDA